MLSDEIGRHRLRCRRHLRLDVRSCPLARRNAADGGHLTRVVGFFVLRATAPVPESAEDEALITVGVEAGRRERQRERERERSLLHIGTCVSTH